MKKFTDTDSYIKETIQLSIITFSQFVKQDQNLDWFATHIQISI